MSVNPQFGFPPFIGADGIKADADQLLLHCNEARQETKANPFPVEAFPLAVQQIIKATNEGLNFPVDFIGSSLLYAVSVGVGNTHKIEVKRGWLESPVLYMALVARRGVNKSHPLDWALKPIGQRDGNNFQVFQKKKREYDVIANLAKKEREAQGDGEPIKPTWEQHLVSDFTTEALIDVHKFNRRGVGVYSDELSSWINNFNRYNKGSDEQLWLSVWSGKSIRINRKSSDPILIECPYISVAGTTQLETLGELAANRTSNGFLDRVLFAVLENLKKEYWSEKELNPAISESWQSIIFSLLDLPLNQDLNNNIQPTVLSFAPQAKSAFTKWYNENVDQSNEAENDASGGIYSKFVSYTARLALILELMKYACNESDKRAVSLESMQGALKLVEYFKKSAIRVHAIISNTSSPLDKLPTDRQTLYNALPDNFTTEAGLDVAKRFGVIERTFKNFLNEKELFNKASRGKYEKRI
jgi:hypothetical protein